MKSGESFTAATSSKCPDRIDLEAYRDAKLPRSALDQLESHVASCDSCSAAIDAFDERSDTIVQALCTWPEGPDDEPEFRELQAKLRSETHSLDGTITEVYDRGRGRAAVDLLDVVGGYQLLELIGSGATGTVFKARHLKLDRTVAVKVLSSTPGRENLGAVSQFLHEMKAVGQLDHPHIIRATDAGEDQGRHYLVMEYHDGIDLSGLLRLTGPLRIPDACELARQTALALEFAHRQRMVHRDVKPSNVLFTLNGQAKLLDLGLVTRHDHPLTWESDGPRGTADYMPPEQWQYAAAIDARADLYGLGAMLFKLLAGHAPFQLAGRDTAAKYEAHVAAPVPSLRGIRPEIPLGLQRLVEQLLAKAPDDRPSSARTVAEQLAIFARGADLQRLAAHVRHLAPEAAPSTVNELTRGREAWQDKQQGRRRLLLATASVVPIAALWMWLQSPPPPRLKTEVWRPLHPVEPVLLNVGEREPTWTYDATRQILKVDADDDVFLHLGRTITGAFELTTTIQQSTWPGGVGLFFRYRPRQSRSGLDHPLQSIEFVRDGTEQARLVWMHSVYRAEPDGSVRLLEQASWADMPLQVPRDNSSHQLSVRLGQTGVPDVAWDGQRISADWVMSWEARHLSQMTRDRLRDAYLGMVGVVVRGTSAEFQSPALNYLE